MKIGIVNDLRLARETLRRAVETIPNCTTAWLASDGQEAIELARKQPPDLILMDLIMPGVDGVEATRRIMTESPCPILVVTSSVSGNIGRVYEAMGHGALDAVDTPVLAPGGRVEGTSHLHQKIQRIERITRRSRPAPRAEPQERPPSTARAKASSLIAIGSSTGGPKALAQVLTALPNTLDVPVVIVQHVDSAFAAGLAHWLSSNCKLPVTMADGGTEPERGKVYLSRTEEHILLGSDLKFRYSPEPVESHYVPSADAFFQSLVRNWPSPGHAVLLTGMGRDGAEGLLALRRAGWTTIAQDKDSCTVWGMPRAAAEINAATHVLPPAQIGILLAEACATRPTPR